MATIFFSVDGQGEAGENAGVRILTWSALANGDDGSSVELSVFSDRSVQVAGTFGTGGKCVIQGSNDGANWSTLNDAQGVALEFSVSKIEGVQEISRYIRPLVTVGDVTTNLTVTLLAKRSGR